MYTSIENACTKSNPPKRDALLYQRSCCSGGSSIFYLAPDAMRRLFADPK